MLCGFPFNRPHATPLSESCYHGWSAQFACPTGSLGTVAGFVMARRHEALHDFAVKQLQLQPDDHVLEIGFGAGQTLPLLAEQVRQGLVAGIDDSMTAVTQAARRHQFLIKAGRIELQQGTVSSLPYEYARFSKVVAVNNYQTWPNPELDLTEIQRVLRKGGRLTLGLRLGSRGPLRFVAGFTEDEVQEIAGLVRWVGFENVQLERSPQTRHHVCVTAIR